jgi:ABC-type Co2+ transport system permease subunit
LNVEEIVIIALTAAAVFSILDVFIPAAGSSARSGLGTAAGINMLGGLRIQ